MTTAAAGAAIEGAALADGQGNALEVPMFSDLIAQGAAIFPIVACGLVLCLATAATSLAVRHHRAGQPDADQADDVGDQLFWDLFAGAAVAVPAVVMASLASPVAGLVIAVAGAVAGFGAYLKYPQLAAWRTERRRRRAALAGLDTAVQRHQETIATWRRYELDPGLAIDFPAMCDVRQPETARLIRAIRSAEAVNPSADPVNYSRAVDRLEHALRQAEAAAGRP
ncbi:hypothetical protein V1638_11930 [Pseudarthrobacter sp. J64]|uniref:hypothetical protein n=1 Tax=Pseudarthrobacter sp. J64 TaxID=3116485 RepID=UPI002E802503|nr:hypothetical protein [Pseudarthrobacter sp. J64]MEE2570099.1 hypothetical protein [Pseudarthrobacter sp. J64]